MESKRLKNFVKSHSIEAHPLARSKKKTKIQYYRALYYFVSQCANDTEYTNARLEQYRTMLVDNANASDLTREKFDNAIRSLINDWLRPWMWKYRYWLMCDIALILADKGSIMAAQETMAEYLGKRQVVLLKDLISTLLSDDKIPEKLLFAEGLIQQFRLNRNFVEQPEIRTLITANMSAGKSTLINALIGKPVTRTSQEACTANLCFLFNKPFEDRSVHLLASPLNLNATHLDLMSVEKTSVSYVASYFRALVQPKTRICFIDTPGVNSSMNREHGKLTKRTLVEEKYDKIIYILNANKLGTDEEIKYLKFIYENTAKDKIIFVLNKLDDFRSNEDSITESIDGVREDLIELGYENPVICPISAYFALLLKMKLNDEPFTEDEQDVFDLYKKKFSKAEYDLSRYSNGTTLLKPFVEDELSSFGLKCGLYGLENIIYGGIEI